MVQPRFAQIAVVPGGAVRNSRDGALYLQKISGWPFRRTPVWIACGKPISCFPELQKSAARVTNRVRLAAAFKNVYAELGAKNFASRR
jgi:hypothetical protein